MKNALRLIGTLFFFSLLFGGAPVSADVNDFTITSYDIHYLLGRDAEKRSTLTTEETIVARFPDINQNHGIERYLPRDYDGHSTGLTIRSVTDASGQAWNYSTYDSGKYQVLRIGDANTYVHGDQIFHITYTRRDVTRFFADTGKTEFYWDTNGTQWRVPIEKLNVTLKLNGGISAQLRGIPSCYQGRYGEKEKCQITRDADSMSVSATGFDRGDNITLALGFSPGTFAEYEKSLFEKFFIIWLIVQADCLVVMLIIIFFLAYRYERWKQRKNELGTIVPEYLPPRDASIQASSQVIGKRVSFAAQLMDFAVRHYIKIFETKPKGRFSNAEYTIKIMKSPYDLLPEEREFLEDIFRGNITVGNKISTKKLRKDTTLASRLRDNPKKLKAFLRGEYGLRQKDENKSGWFKRFGQVLLVVAIILLSPPLLIAAILSFVLGYTLWPLTDKGLDLYRYLEGLKMYIGVAEEERLKMLQSPDGVAKTNVDGSDKGQLLKLYESVLPYAILFGQEKEWNKRLGEYYETTQTQPDWYTGAALTTFNVASFSSAMNNLTSTISSSGASSSSSGGSDGGGFSGGGGGGGGGGGW